MEKKYLSSIKKRLEESRCTPYIYSSLEWYVKTSIKYKTLYYILNIIAIITPLLTSLIAVFLDNTWVSLYSSIGSIAVSLLGLFECQKKWKLYRETAEKLKGIIELNLATNNTKSKEFLMECIDLFSEENNKWRALLEDNDNDK